VKRLAALASVSFFLASCAGQALRPVPAPGGSAPLVTFVFDDGNDTDFLVGKGIFEARGAVACSAITTDRIGTKDRLTPLQIVGLRDAGWEIMSHTASHPDLRSLSPADLEREMTRSRAALENLGLTVENIVYPYNKSDEKVRAAAGRHYRSGRGGGNAFNAGEVDPMRLKSFSLKHDIAGAKDLIDRASADGSWLIFYQHEIDVHVKIEGVRGEFAPGEDLAFSPSGAAGRYVTTHWFPLYGYDMYLVPLAGTPRPGDVVTGASSGAISRVGGILYDDPAQLSEMIDYIRSNHPGMRIVTIDQGLDLRGVPKRKTPSPREAR
jgi:peptidoglycan/xylan/chitin deacetylase (PgdA/CDA1 family)